MSQPHPAGKKAQLYCEQADNTALGRCTSVEELVLPKPDTKVEETRLCIRLCFES